jgi:hypothetical protein
MPQLTFDITDATRQRLDLVVADYNATNGTSLTLEEWLDLHLRELAVQREFATRVEQLKRQTEDDLHAAINAERERLLSSVAGGDA